MRPQAGAIPASSYAVARVVQWDHESLVQVGNLVLAIANTALTGILRDRVRQREVDYILFSQNVVPVSVCR